ncbi:MAG: hypothetical protein O3A93_01810 [Chloroflexi bacterium]|nr:hypothetical protein [Chloroflexota bacterium]MDA1269982.1 hypothetical protein [Chloroflexota bacterium]
MAEEGAQGSDSFQGMDRAQLEIYVREFQQHYRGERRLRRELERHNKELEQRVREVTALNKVFQQHLVERDEMVAAYKELMAGLEQVSRVGLALVERAKAQPLPDQHAGEEPAT